MSVEAVNGVMVPIPSGVRCMAQHLTLLTQHSTTHQNVLKPLAQRLIIQQAPARALTTQEGETL
jgi:hypothetical protein